MHLLRPYATRKWLGEWVQIKEYPSQDLAESAAYDLRERTKPGIPPGDWDACARGTWLWICYYGEGPQK